MPFGSGEEDFKVFFTIYGHEGHLDHVTQMWQINCRALRVVFLRRESHLFSVRVFSHGDLPIHLKKNKFFPFRIDPLPEGVQ